MPELFSAFFRPLARHSFCVALLAGLSILPGVALASISEQDVLALQNPALSGRRAAVRQLFVLYPQTSGAVTEAIDDIFGRLARHYPQRLLEQMQRGHAGGCVNLANTVDLTDRTAAQIHALDARRAALLTVRKAALVPLRDACVRNLDSTLQIMRNALREEQAAPRGQE